MTERHCFQDMILDPPVKAALSGPQKPDWTGLPCARKWLSPSRLSPTRLWDRYRSRCKVDIFVSPPYTLLAQHLSKSKTYPRKPKIEQSHLLKLVWKADAGSEIGGKAESKFTVKCF